MDEYELIIVFKSETPFYEIRSLIVDDLLDNFNNLQMWDFQRKKDGIISKLKQENEQLKAQFDKLLDFVAENYIDECDVCELTDTCINSEGVCPFAWSNRNIKDLIIKHINRS